jgi:hypothetical protein
MPYCTIQAAANAVAAGDTVLINGDGWGYSNYDENVIVTRSGTASAPITFKAAQASFRLNGKNAALHIENSSYVNFVGADVWAFNGPAITVSDSSNIVIDRSAAEPVNGAGVKVTGQSSNVTVRRSLVSQGDGIPGIEVDASASNTVVSTDMIGGGIGVDVLGAHGTDVTSNTIAPNCSAGISITGAASLTNFQNNVVVPSHCFTSAGQPGVVVDSSSSGSTMSGYNVVATDSGNRTPYSWAGTAYSTAAAFQSATGQGAADIVVPSFDLNSDAVSNGNPAIDSANSDAPGELTTDITGNARVDDPSVPNTGAGAFTYYDRGAAEFTEFSGSTLTAYFDNPQRVTVSLLLQGFAWGSSATATFSWGDGTAADTVTLFTLYQQADFGIPYNHMYESRGTHTVTVTLTDSTQTLTKTLVVSPHGSTYSAVTPTRVLDTRHAIGAPASKVGPNGTVAVNVTSGVSGAPPASTITAVVLNVTVTDTTSGGYITAYPDGGSLPKSSNLNFSPGETVPNLVTVKVRNGKVDLYNGSAGTVDLIADVQGYYVDSSAGKGYQPISPVRLLDTRKGIGGPQVAVAPGGTLALRIEGTAPFPASGVSAVVLNVTVTAPTGGGYITVYPGATTMPKASNLNYSPGETVPNLVVVAVGANGTVAFHNTSSGTVQLIADAEGYYGASAPHAFIPADPRRLLDTRTAIGQESATGIPAAPDSDVRWALDGSGLDGQAALVANVTVTRPQAGGYITAYPGGTTRPTASNLNFSAGETVPNLVMVSADWDVSLYNASAGNTDLIVDLAGFFS